MNLDPTPEQIAENDRQREAIYAEQESMSTKTDTSDYKPCPFCGSQPVRRVEGTLLSVYCPQCVTVGFRNHTDLGCLADNEWNTRTRKKYERL